MTSTLLRRDDVIVGVDTHKDEHVAVLLDGLGGRLAEMFIPATIAGFEQLLSFCLKHVGPHGKLFAFGVEGTGSYGVGLARFLRRNGHRVQEVHRPPRNGERPARTALTSPASSPPAGASAGPAPVSTTTGSDRRQTCSVSPDTSPPSPTATPPPSASSAPPAGHQPAKACGSSPATEYDTAEHLDDAETILVINAEWTYTGTGWLTTADAALANAAANAARERRPTRAAS